jgi:hypothetical protein
MTDENKTKPKKLTPDEATREVYRLFCRGLTRDHIVEHAKANRWGLTARLLADVIDKATERLIETAAMLNLDTELGKALGRLEILYQDAIDAKETKTALAVQKEINSLLRLSERARHNGGAVPLTGAGSPATETATGPRRIKFAA